MVSISPEVHAGVTAIAVLLSAALVGSLRRYRDREVARSLLGLGVAMLLSGVLHLGVVDLGGIHPALGSPWWQPTETGGVVLRTTTTVVMSGLWSVFAFQYTGRSRRVIRAVTAVVTVLSVAAIAAALGTVQTTAPPVLFQLLGDLLVLSGTLVIAGVFLLLWASVGENAFPFREPLLLSAGAVSLLSGMVLAQAFEQSALFPALVSVAGGLFLFPVVRYPIFETLPAARVAGRDRIVAELREGILVLDRNGRIRDLNPAAESLFDVTSAAVLGEAHARLLPAGVSPTEVVDSEEPTRVEREDGTLLEIRGERITDQRDRQFGTLLVCVDITDQLRREEQLTLLSQFVVDVVRDTMAETARAAGSQTAGDTPTADERRVAAELWQRATTLTTLVAQTRAIEEAIADEKTSDDSKVNLRRQLQQIAATDSRENGPTVSIDLPDESRVWTLDPALVQLLVEPVFEDAYDNAATRVEVEASLGDALVLTVSDDRAATAENVAGEDPLLALAVTRLALDELGGGFSVQTTDGNWREVSIRLPTGDRGPRAPPGRAGET